MIDFFRHSPFADAISEAGVVAIDIGARGGFDTDLLPIAWAVDAIGFEPEPEAHARLAASELGPWRSLTYYPLAVSGGGRRVLHVPSDPEGASLLEHDSAIGRRFGYPHLFDRAREVTIETTTLDAAAAKLELASPSYLKLDVEGAELEILEAGETVLASLVAIKTEAAFLPIRKGQPLAWDLAAFLGGHGFEVMDLAATTRWRYGPVAPHPYLRRAAPAYSRGQAVQCDLLFFRAPDRIAGDAQRLRAVSIAFALGYFDHAKALIEGSPVRDRFDPAFPRQFARLSRRYGRRACARAIGERLRELVPLCRSATFGLPD